MATAVLTGSRLSEHPGHVGLFFGTVVARKISSFRKTDNQGEQFIQPGFPLRTEMACPNTASAADRGTCFQFLAEPATNRPLLALDENGSVGSDPLANVDSSRRAWRSLSAMARCPDPALRTDCVLATPTLTLPIF